MRIAYKIPNVSNSKLLINQVKKQHKSLKFFSFAYMSSSLPVIITEQSPQTITKLHAPTPILSHLTSQLSPAFSNTTPADMFALPSCSCQDSTMPISLQVHPDSVQAAMSSSPSSAQPACISQPGSCHEVSTSMRCKIHTLQHLACLCYLSIVVKSQILLSTVYRRGH